MLYDGAIAAIQRAVNAMEAHDVQQKCTHLNKAHAIIAQLEGTLNFELGGEVAQTLKTLYVYARTQMLKANIEDSAEMLRSLIDKLSVVREAWYEAEHKEQPHPSAPPARAGARREAWYEAPPEEPSSSPATSGLESPYEPLPTRERGTWRVSA
jgi:flagellar protein FliS